MAKKEDKAGEALPSLPQREVLTNDEAMERGRDAEDFLRSPACAYFMGGIDRMVLERKLEKVDLGRSGGDRLRDLVTEIEVLEQVKSLTVTDTYNAKQAAIKAEKELKGA